MTDETIDLTNDEREYSLDELSTLADVSPRTVRYYIVEGLLPPPLTTGRNATYSQEHLDRLNAIAAMKEMYLPLREIRHRLNTLTPEQMRDPAYLASLSQAVSMDRAARSSGRRAAMHAERAMFRGDHRGAHRRAERRPDAVREHAMAQPRETQPSTQSWDRIPLGDDAELLIRSHKAQQMGPHLYRTLHKLRHMIENVDNEDERSRS